VSYVDLLFPKLQYFFKSGIHGKACYAPTELQNTSYKAYQPFIIVLLGHFKQSTAMNLKELASQSVGINNNTQSLRFTIYKTD
jgi:transposase